jgi:hypothetical protein
MSKDKISRICWNSEGWRKPSGKDGKSKSKGLYESSFGYGHEEWLLDMTKLIDGWQYAFLQPINSNRSTYIGQVFNISLYAINNETKKRWWIGQILDVAVTTPEESRKVYAIYKQKGWLKEMAEQLRTVDADVQDFKNDTVPQDFAVIKFRPESRDILDTPMEFDSKDSAVTSNYYSTLLNFKQTPNLLENKKQFEFSSGHNRKKSSATSYYEEHTSSINLVHNQIQTKIYQQLAEKFGKKNVGTEQSTGYGSQIDLVVKRKEGFIFYEIKTLYSVRLSIRKALSQLLEYGYFPDAENATKLIIVSPNKITEEAESYMESLRNHFDIPIYYQVYNTESESLDDTLY